MISYIRLFLSLCIMMPFVAVAQRTVTVNGTYTYIVGDNDDISLREAKVKCIELAKAEAIKAEFGEMITSDVIDTNLETN